MYSCTFFLNTIFCGKLDVAHGSFELDAPALKAKWKQYKGNSFLSVIMMFLAALLSRMTLSLSFAPFHTKQQP